ncbi:hypothetical protein DFH07DRAFT_1038152 [Mycena maculata]|uniref:Ubiquitin-like domain-containing protein n=1 Tax=Mycena maculata TaxID=230809 RepID=A0AAD7IQ88_9AGAR|nr:hypothetical protein DFH07DRAFT_1038152 [Mycena maculata]
MSALFPFGDILALANLALTIAKILRENTGSSGEYQALIAELDSSGTALQSLDQFVSNAGPTKLQYSVENTVKFALSRCQTLMADFLKKKAGSGNSTRDESWRKIGWGLFKKDEIRLLKQQLMDQKATINIMLGLSHCTSLERVLKASNDQQITLASMQYNIQQLPRALGYTWEGDNNHKVIWFIDAVGNKLPIAIELCITRATFEGLLRVYFKNRAGNRYIEQEHYELAEEAEGECPGSRTGTTTETCPSCQRSVAIQDTSGFTCSFCGTFVRDYKSMQDQFPTRTASAITLSDADPQTSGAPAPEERFIRRFLVRNADARAAATALMAIG